MADPIFSDLDPNFKPNPITGDIGRVVDDAAIKGSISNLLLMDKFERPFNEALFAGVRQELFELITPITAIAIRNKIQNVVDRWEPRVENTSVSVVPQPEENGYDITIKFLPRKNINPTVVSFFLDRLA